MEVTREQGETKGRYVAHIDGTDAEAELTYSVVSAHMIIADHTGVPDALAGQGIGKALFDRLVADARAEGVKIVPLCPFVKAQFAKHPETRDVT